MNSAKKVAVITGASSGIGAATARLLAENGFHVIAAARRMDRLIELAAEDSNIEVLPLDVTDQVSVDTFTDALAGRKIDVLINNAGGAFDSASVLDSDPEIWKKTYDVNVVGTVRMTKAITPLMAGTGHIVVMSSTAGHVAYEIISKHASART